MKKIILILAILFTTVYAYADHVFTVTVSDEDYKVLQWQLIDPDQWVIDAIRGKINKSSERMLIELTDKRPDKLTTQEKIDLIKNSTLQTRIQRDAEELAKGQ